MISCILLAAGESKRFGSLKQLAKIGGKTVMEFIVRRLLATSLYEIIVVLGAQAPNIEPFIPDVGRIKVILNENYHLGQTSSFKKGLGASSQKTRGFLLLPVDMPAIKPETIDQLIKTFGSKKCLIAVPIFEDRRGHPPIFSQELRQEFLDLDDSDPLYTIQRRHMPEIFDIPVSDPGVLSSFNTPEEFDRLIKNHVTGL